MKMQRILASSLAGAVLVVAASTLALAQTAPTPIPAPTPAPAATPVSLPSSLPQTGPLAPPMP
jgi:hypothetical protein